MVRGTTFIELLIAILVFGLALVPLFDVFSKGSGLIKATRESVVAVNLASEVVDQISGMHYQDIPVLNGYPLDSSADQALLWQGRPGSRLFLTPLPEGFSRILSIVPINSKAKKITAQIVWGGSPEHQVTISGVREWSP